MKTEGKVNMESPEGKRIAILDQQKNNLKKEIEDIWKKVEGQEAELQKRNNEVRLLTDLAFPKQSEIDQEIEGRVGKNR